MAEEQLDPGSLDAGSTVVRPRRPIWRRWKVIIGVPLGILVLLFVLALVFGESSSGGGSYTRCENARDRLDAVRHSLSKTVDVAPLQPSKQDVPWLMPLHNAPQSLSGDLLNQESSLEQDVKRHCE